MRWRGYSSAWSGWSAPPALSRSRRRPAPTGASHLRVMRLELDDAETRALLNLLVEALEADRGGV